MKAGFAEVNGTQLRYEVRGEGEPLVLVHGFTLSLEMWEPQMEEVCRHFQVLRYDLRGFGKSDLPDGTPYRHAEDLAALLDSLAWDKVSVLGCSMGGGIAVDFALGFPKRTKALIPFDSALGGFAYSPEFNSALSALDVAAKSQGLEAARKLWMANAMFAPVLHSQARDDFKKIAKAYSGWHWLNKDFTRRYEVPAAKRLSEIRVPTLVMVGELDVPDMQGIAETLHQQISGAQKADLPGVGHMANMENPQLFNQTVLDFLKGVA